jgi:alpha-ketoglutarate-dependent taurine dioxygenase
MAMSERQNWAPEVFTPAGVGAEPTARGLVDFLGSADVAGLLRAHQALLFRGFGVHEPELAEVSAALLPERLAYIHGNTPRTKVGDNLYTSTEYPAEYSISLHNELSYSDSWPARLLFCCVQPAASGGATPLLDGAQWLEALDDRIREDFAGGVVYRRFLHGGRGLGKSWQATFETEDRERVEELLTAGGVSWEWTAAGALRTRHARPSTIRHPDGGPERWFNQADQWHPATLGEQTMRELASIVPAEELPQSVTFADGRPIPDGHVLAIRDLGLRLAVDVAWAEHDVLLIDNVAVAHGRRPFSGARRVLVAMSN